ncbi:MAG: hypothetical protein OXL97_11925 [Chloroflexota bacterium]|nr:hypothetical protein [Chloroflexota bacterium]MDE2885181.1 hypothetical protein [Chloroflexota bacterium]
MEYPVSRAIVQRICDERDDLVPYLTRLIDNMERHGGLYETTLAEVVPIDVIEELAEWLQGHETSAQGAPPPPHGGSRELRAGLQDLERLFPEYVEELLR